jgi:hypothetical protein
MIGLQSAALLAKFFTEKNTRRRLRLSQKGVSTACAKM